MADITWLWPSLAKNPLPWEPGGDFSEGALRPLYPFLIQTRVFSYRNFAGIPFPIAANAQTCNETAQRSMEYLSQQGLPLHIRLGECEHQHLRLLKERHLIPDFPVALPGKKGVKHVALSPQAERFAWINEVEHLTQAQVFAGLPNPSVLMEAEANMLPLGALGALGEASQPWARSADLGYLTSNPLHAGPGISFQCMLHLPALSISHRIKQVRAALVALGVAFYPISRRSEAGLGIQALGESESALYWVASGAGGLGNEGLGKTALEAYQHFTGILEPLLQWENASQIRVRQNHLKRLEERIRNSLNLLASSHTLQFAELLAHGSWVRLGGYLGILDFGLVFAMEELRVITQSGHLQVSLDHAVSQEEEDLERSNVVRLSLVKRRA